MLYDVRHSSVADVRKVAMLGNVNIMYRSPVARSLARLTCYLRPVRHRPDIRGDGFASSSVVSPKQWIAASLRSSQ